MTTLLNTGGKVFSATIWGVQGAICGMVGGPVGMLTGGTIGAASGWKVMSITQQYAEQKAQTIRERDDQVARMADNVGILIEQIRRISPFVLGAIFFTPAFAGLKGRATDAKDTAIEVAATGFLITGIACIYLGILAEKARRINFAVDTAGLSRIFMQYGGKEALSGSVALYQGALMGVERREIREMSTLLQKVNFLEFNQEMMELLYNIYLAASMISMAYGAACLAFKK